MGIFKVKPVINKNNNQINLSLPKKTIPKEVVKEIEKQKHSAKKMLLEFKGWD